MADQRRIHRRQKSSTVREKGNTNTNSNQKSDSSPISMMRQQNQILKSRAISPANSSHAEESSSKDKEKNASVAADVEAATTIKSEKPEEKPSTWSWIPTLISSMFGTSAPDKRLEEESTSPPPTPPRPNESSIAAVEEKRENQSESQPKPLPEISSFPIAASFPQLDADEKCSTGKGDASPQTSDDERKAPAPQNSVGDIASKKADDKTLLLKESNATLISVNVEEVNADASLIKELTAQPEEKREVSNVKNVFARDPLSSPGEVLNEPSVKPTCSFRRLSFSRFQTVHMLPNTKQRVHKKIVRSRHDAWRKYGALKVIHESGGWAYTMNGKAKTFYRVEKGTPLPPQPAILPILTEEEFHKRPIITVSSTSKSKRQRKKTEEKKESKGDTDTSLSEDEPPSC